jgi:hypothetical protein
MATQKSARPGEKCLKTIAFTAMMRWKELGAGGFAGWFFNSRDQLRCSEEKLTDQAA